ncbi:MAG: phosphatase PAP2 family protein [Patescibacteria group bacterium]
MKIKNVIFFGLLWGVIYFGTNNIMLFTAREFPLFPFESKISMNEYWMIPYVSWIIYIVAFCLSIKKEARKFILLATLLVVIHALIFIFYPVEFPRHYDFNSLCAVNKFLLSCDNPRNCFPSLHVSLIFLTLLSARLLGISKIMRYLFAIWGAVIMISVIFVKQHYLIDVLVGIIMTTIYFYLFKNRFRESF